MALPNRFSLIQPWITYSPEQIRDTPSRHDGVTESDELRYRAKTVLFVESLCKHERLKCSLLAQACACVYFHRFYQHQSFKKHDRFVVVVACLFLACKVEEEPKRIKDVVTAYFDIRSILNRGIAQVTDEQKTEMLDKVLVTERIVLQTLAFELKHTNPIDWLAEKFGIIKKYIRDENKKVVKDCAKRFLTDCYRSTIPIQHIQKDIALSTLFLATLELGEEPIQLTSNKMEVTWLDLFEADITEEALNDVCNMIIDVYESVVNIIDPTKASKLRQRLKDSNRVGPSPNCVATSPSIQSAHNGSPNWPNQDGDDSYLFEGENEERKTYNVTVSKMKRSGDGSLLPHSALPSFTPPVPPPPSSLEQYSSSSPFHAPSPSTRPPPPPPPESPWSERSGETPAHLPPPGTPPPPPPETPEHESFPPPAHEYTESPVHENTQSQGESDRKKNENGVKCYILL